CRFFSFIRILFFFSSRRRHTRFSRDWSSDVCSSDLPSGAAAVITRSSALWSGPVPVRGVRWARNSAEIQWKKFSSPASPGARGRSEERRVGKEWSCRRERGDGREKVESIRGRLSLVG